MIKWIDKIVAYFENSTPQEVVEEITKKFKLTIKGSLMA